MLTRPIPSSGEALPVVGLGTYQTFDVGNDVRKRRLLAEVLRKFYKSGGSLIDSSPMYGRAEEVCGDVLASISLTASVFLATKVWTHGQCRGVDQMRESMAKLQTDQIDLMQIHNLVDWRRHLSTMREWQAQGMLRYLGITHYTAGAFAELEEIITHESIDFVQLPYSIALRTAESRILSVAADHGVGVIVNRPFEGGSLFDAVDGISIPTWANEFDCSNWSVFFLKYLISHPAVTCVIPATRNIDHLVDMLQAGIGVLPDDSQKKRMNSFIEEL